MVCAALGSVLRGGGDSVGIGAWNGNGKMGVSFPFTLCVETNEQKSALTSQYTIPHYTASYNTTYHTTHNTQHTTHHDTTTHQQMLSYFRCVGEELRDFLVLKPILSKHHMNMVAGVCDV